MTEKRKEWKNFWKTMKNDNIKKNAKCGKLLDTHEKR